MAKNLYLGVRVCGISQQSLVSAPSVSGLMGGAWFSTGLLSGVRLVLYT